MIVNESWEQEWNYSKKFMPEIIRLLHNEFKKFGWGDPKIWEADYDEDISHNTDLFAEFPNGDLLRIAVRVRYPNFIRYSDEITVRCFLALNGKLHEGKTEFQKMLEGWGDLICYCIAAPDNQKLASFFLGDANALREYARLEAQEFGEYETVRTKNDTGRVRCYWNPKRMRVAGNTGCGFLCYKKEGPDAVPGISIADYKFGG